MGTVEHIFCTLHPSFQRRTENKVLMLFVSFRDSRHLLCLCACLMMACLYTTIGLTRTFRALSTIFQNRLIEVSLLERISMNVLSHFLPLSTKSADKPKIGMASSQTFFCDQMDAAQKRFVERPPSLMALG